MHTTFFSKDLSQRFAEVSDDEGAVLYAIPISVVSSIEEIDARGLTETDRNGPPISASEWLAMRPSMVRDAGPRTDER